MSKKQRIAELERRVAELEAVVAKLYGPAVWSNWQPTPLPKDWNKVTVDPLSSDGCVWVVDYGQYTSDGLPVLRYTS